MITNCAYLILSIKRRKQLLFTAVIKADGAKETKAAARKKNKRTATEALQLFLNH